MAYRVDIKRSARKAIDRIPQRKARQRVEDRIEALADDPRPADSLPLQGELGVYRRVREGSYGIVYEVRDEDLVVLIMLVAQREKATAPCEGCAEGDASHAVFSTLQRTRRWWTCLPIGIDPVCPRRSSPRTWRTRPGKCREYDRRARRGPPQRQGPRHGGEMNGSGPWLLALPT